MRVELTIKQKIHRYLSRKPYQSAWQISKEINESVGSVSSILLNEVKLGRLNRTKDHRCGPRGGYVYWKDK
jgi:predicted transcriptional regulator